MREFRFDDRIVTEHSHPEVIVEIGINHGGDLSVAKKMVDSALGAGAQLIKHQTHIPDAEMSSEARSVVPGNSSKSIYEVISHASLSESDEWELCQYTRDSGGIFFSSPFSREAVDRLVGWDVPLFKVGSGECNNFPLLEHIASARKPTIVSTGMNSLATIREAVKILSSQGSQVAILHTTNLYPTPQRLIRLGGVTDLLDAFPNNIIGLSDHSVSNAACLGAITLGAKFVERHFTDSKRRAGPDIICSMNPRELKQLLVFGPQIVEACGGRREPADEEQVTMDFAFASCVTIREIRKGETFSVENTWVKRPGTGDLKASDLHKVFGRVSAYDLPPNVQIPLGAVQ